MGRVDHFTVEALDEMGGDGVGDGRHRQDFLRQPDRAVGRGLRVGLDLAVLGQPGQPDAEFTAGALQPALQLDRVVQGDVLLQNG